MLADPAVDLPAASRMELDRILAGTFSWIARVEAMRWAMEGYETGPLPEGGLTTIPTWTAEPGQILAGTATPTSERTKEAPTPTSTEASSGTEPSEATSAPPTATSEPSPTSALSATETPSPTPAEEKPTKETPPGQTKTPLPPGIITRTPTP